MVVGVAEEALGGADSQVETSSALKHSTELEVMFIHLEWGHREEGNLAPDEVHRVGVGRPDDLREVDQ